jgi:hypothetical protein
MPREFPAAYYGKPPEPGGKDQYGLIGCTRDFPRETVREFERLATSIQWSGGGGDDPYSDCFVLWPVGTTGAIVARLRDVGRDQMQRPHTLWIEGAWIASREIGDWLDVSCRLLQPAAWPDAAPPRSCGPLRLNPHLPRPQLGEEVDRALAEGAAPPTLLIATHRNFRAGGFVVIHDPGYLPGDRPPVNRQERPAGIGTPDTGQTEKAASAAPRFHRVLTMCLVAACLVLAGFAAREHYLRRNLQQQIERAHSALKSMEESLENAEASAAETQRQLRIAIDERDGIGQDVRDIQHELDLYDAILRAHDIAGRGQLEARLEAVRQEHDPQPQSEQNGKEMPSDP